MDFLLHKKKWMYLCLKSVLFVSGELHVFHCFPYSLLHAAVVTVALSPLFAMDTVPQVRNLPKAIAYPRTSQTTSMDSGRQTWFNKSVMLSARK
jgi:hypothetical protein